MHTPARIGIDDFQANRCRTNDTHYAAWGLFSRQKDGLYDDGRFATLRDVVNHYNGVLGLKLTDAQKSDLVEFWVSTEAFIARSFFVASRPPRPCR